MRAAVLFRVPVLARVAVVVLVRDAAVEVTSVIVQLVEVTVVIAQLVDAFVERA